MNTDEFLDEVANVLRDRAGEYGDAKTLFGDIAGRWRSVFGVDVSPAQVLLCMIEVKMARLSFNPNHADSIRDIAGYAALIAEVSQ